MSVLKAQNTEIKRGVPTGASETFTAIPNLRSLSSAGGSQTLMETTDLKSTTRTWVTALPDTQEMTFTFLYSKDAQQNALRMDMAAGTKRNYKLEVAGGGTGAVWSFEALVTGWQIGAEVGELIPLEVTLKPTSAITVT